MLFQSPLPSAMNPLVGPPTPLAASAPLIFHDSHRLLSNNIVSHHLADHHSPVLCSLATIHKNQIYSTHIEPLEVSIIPGCTSSTTGPFNHTLLSVGPSLQQPHNSNPLADNRVAPQAIDSSSNSDQKTLAADAIELLKCGQAAEGSSIDRTLASAQTSLSRVPVNSTLQSSGPNGISDSSAHSLTDVTQRPTVVASIMGGPVLSVSSLPFSSAGMDKRSNGENAERITESQSVLKRSSLTSVDVMPSNNINAITSRKYENRQLEQTKHISPVNLGCTSVLRQRDVFGGVLTLSDTDVLATFRRQSNSTRSPFIRPSTTPNYLSMSAPGFFHHSNAVQPMGASSHVLHGSSGISSTTHRMINPSNMLAATLHTNMSDNVPVSSTLIGGSTGYRPTIKTAQRRVLSAVGSGERRRYPAHVLGTRSPGGLPYNVRSGFLANPLSPQYSTLNGPSHTLSSPPRVLAGGNRSIPHNSVVTYTTSSEPHQSFVPRPQRRTFGEFRSVKQTTVGGHVIGTAVPNSSSHSTTTVYGPVEVSAPISGVLSTEFGAHIGSGIQISNAQQPHRNIRTRNPVNVARGAGSYIVNQSFNALPEKRYATAVVNTKNASFFRSNQPHQLIYKQHPITIDPQTGTAIAYGRDPEKLLSEFLKEAGVK